LAKITTFDENHGFRDFRDFLLFLDMLQNSCKVKRDKQSECSSAKHFNNDSALYKCSLIIIIIIIIINNSKLK